MFGLPTALLIKGFAALALLGALTAAYMGWVHHQRDIGRAEVKAQWDSANYAASEAARLLAQQRRGTADKASAGHEADRSEIRTEFVEIRKVVERVVNKIEYRDRVCLDDDGVRAINAAVARTGAAADPGQPVSPMPAAAASR